MSRRLCFALDLVNDAARIAEYETFHAPGQKWMPMNRIFDLAEQKGVTD